MDQEQDFRLSQRVKTHCMESCSLATSLTSNDKVSAVSSTLTGKENMIVCLRCKLVQILNKFD